MVDNVAKLNCSSRYLLYYQPYEFGYVTVLLFV
jgi:hypothetical protein